MNTKECDHQNFRVDAKVGRILNDDKEPPAYYHADIRLNCADCGIAFEWQGLPNGFSPYQPTVSIDGQELLVPAMPHGKMIPKGLPGFLVTHQIFDDKEPTKQ